jgi:hypothetical protein
MDEKGIALPSRAAAAWGWRRRRFEFEEFGKREEFSVKSWYQDVQTGAGADALLLPPN